MHLLFLTCRHFNLWVENAYVKKHPVRYIRLQRHLMGNMTEWKADQLEFFFTEEHGVIGIDGHPKENAKVIISFILCVCVCHGEGVALMLQYQNEVKSSQPMSEFHSRGV